MAAPVVGKMMADILPYLGYEPEYTCLLYTSQKNLKNRLQFPGELNII